MGAQDIATAVIFTVSMAALYGAFLLAKVTIAQQRLVKKLQTAIEARAEGLNGLNEALRKLEAALNARAEGHVKMELILERWEAELNKRASALKRT